jgi:YidC/Oxa1 family membrane protein insertase
MFDALGRLLLPVLRGLLDFTGSLGVAIILFTILTRIFMLPLTLKQLKSQKKTMQLQPHLRELQRKYGKDREKLTQETMKLYQQHGANPVSGCLPLLITLPILFGVWRAITFLVTDTTIPPSALKFLWIPNLALTNGDPFFLLPILSVVCQFIVQQMAMPRNPDPQQAQMNRVMMWMPLMFGWFAFTINSGAVLYMVTGSLIAMVQQFFTTGFGALPKYLPFLPERTGFLTPPPALNVDSEGQVYVDEPAAEPESRNRA